MPSKLILKKVDAISVSRTLSSIRVFNLTELRKTAEDYCLTNPIIFCQSYLGKIRLHLLTNEAVFWCLSSEKGIRKRLEHEDDCYLTEVKK